MGNAALQQLLQFFVNKADLRAKNDLAGRGGGADHTGSPGGFECLFVHLSAVFQLEAQPCGAATGFLHIGLTAQRSQNLTLSLSSSVSQRAASYILATARGGVFRDNHTHLAEFLGCSHRQLLRVLGRLCEQGILCRLEGGGYRVADAARLSSLSGGVYVAEPFTYPGLGLRTPDTSAETKR